MDLVLDQLSKDFGAQRVLSGLTIQLTGVGALVLVGPSGCGKSTLLRILAGLETPTTGIVRLNGKRLDFEEKSLRQHRMKVGTVFQAFNLFPHLTALENVTLPLTKVHGLDQAEAVERALQTFRRFRLEDHVQKRPAQLSGGQRQRVAIVRAVAIRPSLLFFDEPTSALDPEMTAEVLDLIRELREEGRDFILATHEMGFARQVADRILMLGEGKLLENSTPEEFFERPASREAKDFLSRLLKY